jgi:hypothetical protein
VGRELVALDLEEQLRRGTDDLELGRAHEEEIGARVHASEAAVEADAVKRAAGRRVGRQVEGLATGEDHLDRLAGRDRVLGDLDGMDVFVAPEAGLDRAGEGLCAVGAGGRAGELGGAGSGRAFERLEDGFLGDAVAAFEVGGFRVQRGDRRERVGEVVENQDEVGLDERSRGHTDRVALRKRDGGLER